MLDKGYSAVLESYRWQSDLSGDLRCLHVKGVLSQAVLLCSTGVGGWWVRGEFFQESIWRWWRQVGHDILWANRGRWWEQCIIRPGGWVGWRRRGDYVLPLYNCCSRFGLFRRSWNVNISTWDVGRGLTSLLSLSGLWWVGLCSTQRARNRPLCCSLCLTSKGGCGWCSYSRLHSCQCGLLVEEFLDVGPCRTLRFGDGATFLQRPGGVVQLLSQGF